MLRHPGAQASRRSGASRREALHVEAQESRSPGIRATICQAGPLESTQHALALAAVKHCMLHWLSRLPGQGEAGQLGDRIQEREIGYEDRFQRSAALVIPVTCVKESDLQHAPILAVVAAMLDCRPPRPRESPPRRHQRLVQGRLSLNLRLHDAGSPYYGTWHVASRACFSDVQSNAATA
jgi:hypothetical protein